MQAHFFNNMESVNENTSYFNFMFISITHASSSFFYKQHCPKAEDIKKVKMMGAERTVNGYDVSSIDHFNTSHFWVFVLHEIKATSEEGALRVGNQLLNKLHGPPKEQASSKGSWICDYHLPMDGIRAFAGNVA